MQFDHDQNCLQDNLKQVKTLLKKLLTRGFHEKLDDHAFCLMHDFSF